MVGMGFVCDCGVFVVLVRFEVVGEILIVFFFFCDVCVCFRFDCFGVGFRRVVFSKGVVVIFWIWS